MTIWNKVCNSLPNTNQETQNKLLSELCFGFLYVLRICANQRN